MVSLYVSFLFGFKTAKIFEKKLDFGHTNFSLGMKMSAR